MGLKDALETIAKTVTTAVDNAKDAASEASHRAQAQAEQTKRDAAGETLSVGESAASVVNQVKHATLAEIDAAKQEIRNS